MKSVLYSYSVGDEGLTLQRSYALLQDEDGVCRPCTKMLQLSDTLFFMKEDGDATDLHLVNLVDGQVLSTYHCGLRDGKESSYTPFDYYFNVVDDKVLLAYNYMQRMELLCIMPDGRLVPQLFLGDDDLDIMPRNYDELPCVWLEICSDNRYFYCLKSDDGLESGSHVYVLDAEGVPVKQLVLNRPVNSIQTDGEGRLVAYREDGDGGCFFYVYEM